MSSMLEQAIVDANALREAAMQNAENAIIEKYSTEVKEAVERLLEQPEDELGLEDEAPEPDALDQVPPAAGEEMELCPCPDDKSSVGLELNLNDLRQIEAELDAGSPEELDMDEFGVETPPEEDEEDEEGEEETGLSLQESIELDEEVIELEEEDALEEELDESDISELVEELIMDLAGDDLTGWAGRPESDKAYAREIRLARAASTENQEKIEAMKKTLDKLMEQKSSLQKDNNQLKEAVVYLKNKLDVVNLQNAKLHYVNRTLNSVSLNERQKTKIVESIQSSETIEEAKVIYETLQSAVGPSKKQPKSLSEAIQRPSLSIRRKKNSSDDRDTAAKQRFQRLAGIVKD
tara:strand:- start:396 stop:1445 length:1050 start_codon:yes stop_codon:yes gene_type:complete